MRLLALGALALLAAGNVVAQQQGQGPFRPGGNVPAGLPPTVPQKGPAYYPNRVAFIDTLGLLDGLTGNAADCIHIDGSSGPCSTGGGGGGAGGFFTGAETPGGTINGSNAVFTLLGSPSPAGSLLLELNGLAMKQGLDYTLSGATITLIGSAIPQSGDILQAWYNVGAAGIVVNPMTTQGDTLFENAGAPARLADGTLGFHPDYYPSGCTVASVAHPQPADCAFALAAASATANIGAAVVFGPNTYLKNDAWVLPYGSSGFPRPTVSLIGVVDGYARGTTLVQNASIATDMVSTAPGSNPYISPSIRDISFVAKQNAPGCLVLTGVVRSRVSGIYCNGATGTDHFIQIGGGAGAGDSYEVEGDHIKTENLDSVSSGLTEAYGTIGVSGGSLTTAAFTSNGSGYGVSAGSSTAVYIYGFGAGDRPCSTMPTGITATVSGGSITAISWTGGSTCAGPVYFYVAEMAPPRFGIEIATTDSLYTDLVSEGAGQVAGIYVTGANRIVSPHAYYTPVGIKDAGWDTYLAPEFDSTWVYAWALGGPQFSGPYSADSYSNTFGAQIISPTYFWNGSYPGASKGWLYNGGQNSFIEDGVCDSIATWADYHEFVTSGGPTDTTGTLPASFQRHAARACGGTAPSPDNLAYGGVVNGSWDLTTLAAPGTPTVTPAVSGSTTYSYEVVAKMLDGSHSAASAAGSTTTGTSTLSAVDYNAVAWTAVTNAACYDVYKTAGTGAQGLVAFCVVGTTYNDTAGVGNAASAPTTNTSGQVCAGGFCWGFSAALGYQLTSPNGSVIATGSNSGLVAANSLAIGGVTVTGTPSVGYVPTATSSTAATWQAASGGGGSGAQNIEFWFCTKDTVQGNWGNSGAKFVGLTITGSVDDNPCFYSFPSNGTGYAVVHHFLPASWSSSAGMSLTLYWLQTSGGTGNVQWNVSTSCTAAGAAIYNSAPTYNSAQTQTVSAVGGTNLFVTTFSALTQTGCAAGNILQLKVQNTAAGSGGTTYTNAVDAIGVILNVTQ